MKKIPTMFERDWGGDRSRVLDRIAPGCEWVAAGEGTATRKMDGTSCRIRDGQIYKRRELKADQPMPPDFELVDHDPETDKRVGWVLCGGGPEDRWHREALEAAGFPPDGTYELIGPKVQGNPEHAPMHTLVPHWLCEPFHDAPRTFDALREWLTGRDIEGLVFHHSDGRMAKIKLRDFGLKRAQAMDDRSEAKDAHAKP